MFISLTERFRKPAKHGGQLAHQLLQSYCVTHLFGHTGAVLLPLLDELGTRSDPRFIVARHERSATFMAAGYAMATGKPGVVLVTSGPGATNIVPGLALAQRLRFPFIAFTGQVETQAIGTTAFQEVPITAMTQSCTQWNTLVHEANQLPQVFQRAFDRATSSKLPGAGAVLIDLPKDVLLEKPLIGSDTKQHDWRTTPIDMTFDTPIEWQQLLAGKARPIGDATDGFALPAALGATPAHAAGESASGGEGLPFVAVTTAASFRLAMMELCTAAQHHIPARCIVHDSDDQIAATVCAMGVTVVYDLDALLSHPGPVVLCA